MQNPFVTTYSKIPDNSYIPTEQSKEIVENFMYDIPAESVYKITGVRGSGKTVLLAKVEEEILELNNDDKSDKWVIYRISPSRDMLQQLLAYLARDFSGNKGSGKKKVSGVNLSGTILGTGGGISITAETDNRYFDVGIEIIQFLEKAMSVGKKILVGIDEVSRTKDMEIFVAEFGKWLRAKYPIYLVCTGLYENIEQLYNVPNLTFFRRATTIMTTPLNFVKMSEMYRKRLGVDTSKSKELAEITKGYAYAFQELGVISFKHKEWSLEELKAELKTELYAYAYEKIWEELSDGDRALVKLLTDKEEYSKVEVTSRMEKPQNYAVYRDRLIKRGILKKRQGFIGLALPYFGEYVLEYGEL